MLPNVEVTYLQGHAPVQAEGSINGKPFYFRARGQYWTLYVGGESAVDAPEWEYEERYGLGLYDAGYMTHEEALRFLLEAASRCPLNEKETKQ